VRQPELWSDGGGTIRISRNGIRVPLLISAIANIGIGCIWAVTLCGLPLTIGMILLCIFEFRLWSRADEIPLHELASRANTRGIFEIIIGLFNTFTLVCGIIVLINASKIGRLACQGEDGYQ
jgi:hypothetical protein